MDIMKTRSLRAIVLGTLLCCTVINTHATVWSGITALPTKFYAFAWDNGIKPWAGSLVARFLASELCQQAKWGALGASSGVVVGGMSGIAHNIGKEASLISIIMDVGFGSFFGGLCGGIAGVFGRRVKKDLADKQQRLNNVVDNLAQANGNLSTVNKKNGMLQLKLWAARFQAHKLQQDLNAAQCMLGRNRLALKKNNQKFAQEKERLEKNVKALEAQQQENQSKIEAEMGNLKKIIDTRAKAEQVKAITIGVASLSSSIGRGGRGYSQALASIKNCVKDQGEL